MNTGWALGCAGGERVWLGSGQGSVNLPALDSGCECSAARVPAFPLRCEVKPGIGCHTISFLLSRDLSQQIKSETRTEAKVTHRLEAKVPPQNGKVRSYSGSPLFFLRSVHGVPLFQLL